jgi:hypothetical protein
MCAEALSLLSCAHPRARLPAPCCCAPHVPVPDAFVVVFSGDAKGTRWSEIYRSETIDNNLSPV